MKELVEDLAQRYSLSMERLVDASVVEIRKERDITFEVTIPDDVLEWFVVARSNASVIWEDWCDYYPLEKEVDDQLADEMRTDLQLFVAAVVEGEFRVNNGRLEHFAAGAWSEFGIGSQPDQAVAPDARR
jgi:hypothetical protein